MSRPTTSLTLPISGYACELVTYYTKGEDDAISAHGMGDARVVVIPDPETLEDKLEIRDIPTNRNRREVAKLLELGIASAEREGTNYPVDAEFVNNLPTKDVELLSEKLITVRAGDDPKVPSGTETP